MAQLIDSLDLRRRDAEARYWEGNPRPSASISPAERTRLTQAEHMQRAYEALMRLDAEDDYSWARANVLFRPLSALGTMTRTREPEPLVEPTMPPKPEPMAIEQQPASTELAEYDSIAAELGFEPTALKKDRTERAHHALVSFILDSGMPIYNEEHVKKYMDGLVAQKNYEAAKAKRDKGGTGILGLDVPVIGWEWLALSKYKHAIPIDILKRAHAIKAQHPTAEFSVTDYKVVNPDPFISVRIDGGARIVFGVWDEPGFKAIGRDVVATA